MLHFVPTDARYADRWDLIADLVLDPANNSFLVADDVLPGIPLSRWVFRISAFKYVTELLQGTDPRYDTVSEVGIAMGQDIFSILYNGHGHHLYAEVPNAKPALVVVDELQTSNKTIEGRTAPYVDIADVLTWCGYYIGAFVPDLVGGKWAVAVQHAQNLTSAEFAQYDQPNVKRALDHITNASGYAVFEMYPPLSSYCAYGHDPFLEGFFKRIPNGGAGAGFEWVWQNYQLHRHLLRVMFGVHDRFVDPYPPPPDPPDPVVALRYMDRMFYVWKHYCFPSVIARQQGGAGSWRWDAKVTYADRDRYFRNIWNNYVRDDLDGPNYTVICS